MLNDIPRRAARTDAPSASWSLTSTAVASGNSAVGAFPDEATTTPTRALLMSQRGTLTPNSTVSMLDATVRRSVPSAHAAAQPHLRASQEEVQ